MAARSYKVLFVCTGNSARSILAEALLNHLGQGHFVGFSAGSHPARKVNRYALELLRQQQIPTEPLYCKSWREFASRGVAAMDGVIMLSSSLAAQHHPAWPGHPSVTSWLMRDPVAVTGGAAMRRRAMLQTFEILQTRIRHLVALSIDQLGSEMLGEHLTVIGDLPIPMRL